MTLTTSEAKRLARARKWQGNWLWPFLGFLVLSVIALILSVRLLSQVAAHEGMTLADALAYQTNSIAPFEKYDGVRVLWQVNLILARVAVLASFTSVLIVCTVTFILWQQKRSYELTIKLADRLIELGELGDR
jgi:hypothetical protein